MKNFKEFVSAMPAPPAPRTTATTHSIPNVGVKISKVNSQVLIQDRDRVFDDILMQGEEMQQFLEELKLASRVMPDLSIRDALVVVTAPYIAGKWC